MLPQEKQTLSRLRQDTAEWPHLRHSWHWASKAPVEWAVRATPLWAVGGSWAGGEIGGRRVGISIKGVGRWDGWDQGLLDGLGCWGTARWLFQVLWGDCWGCLVPVGGAAEIGRVGAVRGLLGGIWGWWLLDGRAKLPVGGRRWALGWAFCRPFLSAMAFQIIDVLIVCSTVSSGADQRKHQTPRHWCLWGEPVGVRWFPLTKGR